MRKLISLLIIFSPIVLASDGTTVEQMEQQARQLVQRFVGELKPQLKGAMAEGGPAYAIEVCSEVAPRIADSLAVETGWRVSRVSLQQRNASRATPDSWERQVLEEFDRERAAGVPAEALTRSGIVRGRYRYMQAQVTEGLCLACHGESLSQPARAALEMYYPDDKATGYGIGAVRGAISLSRAIAGEARSD